MGIAIMIAQFILSLSILIVLHELGHFIPAKVFKTKVEKFFLFFDVKFALFKKKIGETVYGIGWLPLGGYVKIAGMIDESMDREQMQGPPQPWEFRSKTAWQRLIIMLGGVTVNFILGFFIFAMLLWAYGEEYLPAENATYGIVTDSLGKELGLEDGDKILKIGSKDFDKFSAGVLRTEIGINDAREITVERRGRQEVVTVSDEAAKLMTSYAYKDFYVVAPAMPCIVKEVSASSPAERSGLRIDDQIIMVNNRATPFFRYVVKELRSNPNTHINYSVLRGSDTVALSAQVTEDGTLGFLGYQAYDLFETKTKTYTFTESLPAGVKKGWNFLATQVKAFGQMFKGKVKASDSLGGFVSISNLFSQTWDWPAFWHITAILSLILGFMNLLPIPGLDGGHVMFLLWEVVTGKKPSDNFLERATTIGFILLLALLLYANGLDILRACN